MLTNPTLVPEQYRAVTKVKAGKDNFGSMMYRDAALPCTSCFGYIYASELLMGLRSVEEEKDRIIDVTPDKSLSEQADANQLKHEILGAKSTAALDEAESNIF